jgi:hypothetical protein
VENNCHFDRLYRRSLLWNGGGAPDAEIPRQVSYLWKRSPSSPQGGTGLRQLLEGLRCPVSTHLVGCCAR